VLDSCGAVLTGYTGPVTIAIQAGTGTTGAALGGTTPVNAVNGVATFNNLTIDLAGADYVLIAGPGTASGDSPAFRVDSAPVASNGSLTTNEDTPASGALSATYVENDPLTYSIVANGSNGLATITDAATGAFTYTPNADFNGSDSFTFTANDGTIDSKIATVSIFITPVNDAPSFTLGLNQTIMASAGPQSIAGWATSFTTGPSDEASQTVLAYQIVSNSDPTLFAAAPAIDLTDQLTYTPKTGTGGTATIGVVARDSGGTANGGVDTSAVKTFTITVGSGYRVYVPIVTRT
jgi:hypothetical protein